MKEIWIQATEIYNLPLTIGLIFFCAYWVISSIGIFDFDADMDIDVDAGGSAMGSILGFVNATEVPVMFVLSVLNLSMWVISMISNELLNASGNIGVAAGLFVVNFIISVLIVKFVTKPLAPLFKAIRNDVEAAEPLIGQTGKIKSRVLDHTYGQVEVTRKNTAPALLNCKLRESDEAMLRGEEVLIISYDKDSKRYIVRSLNLVNDPLESDSRIDTENLIKINNQTENLIEE